MDITGDSTMQLLISKNLKSGFFLISDIAGASFEPRSRSHPTKTVETDIFIFSGFSY
jgi:hypothetical protein